MIYLTYFHSFIGYFDEQNSDSIDIERVLKLRKDREGFKWFLDHIASVVVGISYAEENKYLKLPRDWLPRSLEAFSLLCFENYFEMIKNQVKQSSPRIKPLWTADARGKKKNQGWNQDGIKRYNQLIELVVQNRDMYPQEDEVYLKRKREERLEWQINKLKRKKEAIDEREKDLEPAEDDFSSGSDSE